MPVNLPRELSADINHLVFESFHVDLHVQFLILRTSSAIGCSVMSIHELCFCDVSFFLETD